MKNHEASMKNHEKPKITQINPLINHDKPMEFLGVFFSQKNRTQCLEVKSMVTVRRDPGWVSECLRWIYEANIWNNVGL
jgi:hypothetical protein